MTVILVKPEHFWGILTFQICQISLIQVAFSVLGWLFVGLRLKNSNPNKQETSKRPHVQKNNKNQVIYFSRDHFFIQKNVEVTFISPFSKGHG